MFTNYKMYKLPYTSSASRAVYRYRIRRSLYWKSPRLSLHKPWYSGCNDSGQRVLRSRSALLYKTRAIQINYYYMLRGAYFVSNFLFLPYKNKLLALIRYVYGMMSYEIATTSHQLFTPFYPYRNKKRNIFFIGNTLRLLSFPNLCKICLIELVPGRGAQYCRSSGTIAKIMKLDRKKDMALIKLPSGRTKLFSIFSFASAGRVLFKENRNFTTSKAGYWRGFGFKPTVRGVAMNPVDHPHGGRTNSIRYPRTPWGTTAKYK